MWLQVNSVTAAQAASRRRVLCYNFVSTLRRYRLGVRTEDSQSSNPGSIPGSATNYIRQSPLIQRVLFLPKKVGGALCRQKGLPVVHKMVHRDFDPKKAGFSI